MQIDEKSLRMARLGLTGLLTTFTDVSAEDFGEAAFRTDGQHTDYTV